MAIHDVLRHMSERNVNVAHQESDRMPWCCDTKTVVSCRVNCSREGDARNVLKSSMGMHSIRMVRDTCIIGRCFARPRSHDKHTGWGVKVYSTVCDTALAALLSSWWTVPYEGGVAVSTELELLKRDLPIENSALL